MQAWQNESELFEQARERLCTALLADVMDQMGHRNQFLPPDIRPVDPDMVIVGRIMTVLGKDVKVTQTEPAVDPYGLLFDALDALRENEVFVYTGGTPEYAIWGGLMSVRAMQLKAAGAVIDGCYRDTREILNLRFPTFARKAFGPDQKSRGLITDYRCPIEIGGVTIENGDLLFADLDGIVIVPKAVAEVVLRAAFKKRDTENQLRRSLLNGMSAKEAFDKYGIF